MQNKELSYLYKQVILKFGSSALKIECLSMYQTFGAFEKKNCKRWKRKEF